MPVKDNGVTGTGTVGSATSFSFSNAAPNNAQEKNCAAIVWIGHKPSAGAQAVCRLNVPGIRAELIQRKVDGTTLFTLEGWRLPHCPAESFQMTANFDKSVGVAVIVRLMSGVDPVGFSNPRWEKITSINSKFYRSHYDPGHFNEFCKSNVLLEKGSATVQLFNHITSTVVNTVPGMRMVEFNRGNSVNAAGERAAATVLSSSSWLACSVDILGHELTGVQASPNFDLSDEPNEHVEFYHEDIRSIQPAVQSAPEPPPQPEITYDGVMSVVRGK